MRPDKKIGKRHIVAIVLVVVGVGALYLVLANLLFARTYEMLTESMRSRGESNVSRLGELVSWGLAARTKKDVDEVVQAFLKSNPDTLEIVVLDANGGLFTRAGSQKLASITGKWEKPESITSRMNDGHLMAMGPSRSEFIDEPVGYVIYSESSAGYLKYRQNMLVIAILVSILGLGILGKLLREVLARLQMHTQIAEYASALAEANEELRVQIAKRSEQLFSTLALIGQGAKEIEALQPGSVIGERYRIVRFVGEGGMGSVYEATVLSNQQRAALKVAKSGDPLALALLAGEARMAIEVVHDNIVRIIDVDVAKEGFLYVVMEFLDGPTLAEQKHRWGDLDWGLQILAQICQGLEALHSHNLVHRDLKPENIVVSERKSGGGLSVKIVDFGISSWSTKQQLEEPTTLAKADREAASLSPPPTAPLGHEPSRLETQTASKTPFFLDFDDEDNKTLAPTRSGLTAATGMTNEIAGTPRFMAPEQIQLAVPASQSTDIWAVGVIAHRILAKSWPMSDEVFGDLITGVGPAKVHPIRKFAPQIDGAIAELVDSCLHLDPQKRPTAQAIVEVVSQKIKLLSHGTMA